MRLKPNIKVLSLSARSKAAQRYGKTLSPHCELNN